MSRRLVAYGSDDESPDRRRSRDESNVIKRELDETEGDSWFLPDFICLFTFFEICCRDIFSF